MQCSGDYFPTPETLNFCPTDVIRTGMNSYVLLVLLVVLDSSNSQPTNQIVGCKQNHVYILSFWPGALSFFYSINVNSVITLFPTVKIQKRIINNAQYQITPEAFQYIF